MQSEIDSLKNVKLKYALEKHEARFTSLEQRDEEKATLITKLDDDIKEIKQSLANTSSIDSSDLFAQKLNR